MDGVVSSKYFAQGGGGECRYHGDFAPADETGPFLRAAVRRLHDQAGAAGGQPFACLLEARNGIAAAPRQAEQFCQTGT